MSNTNPLVLDPAAQDLLFREARTANTFSAHKVPDKVVRAIYDLVKWAPTSMNQLPLRIVLVRTPEARERLVQHLDEFNKHKTASAPLVAILAADLRFHDELPKLFPHMPEAKDLFEGDPAIREFSATSNAWLQIGFFIMGVRAAGLCAGPMIGFDAEGVTKEFFPDGEHKALLVVNIGKPGKDAWWPRLPRLDYDEVVSTV
ncbi:MAG TPA: malonic semialdehyde reductase [Candidatus Limnocylindrales bacterium]|nr:malonic semialdehyde reductase [Candidatus Limnocylindrales bacterium]